MPLAISCTNEQKVMVTVHPTTAAGNPATLDGGVQATVTSGDATIEMVPSDPNSFFAVSGTVLGQSVIRVFGDADLGSGVVTVEDVCTLDVSGAMAANLGITAAPPVPK